VASKRLAACAALVLAACAEEKPAVKTASQPTVPSWLAKANEDAALQQAKAQGMPYVIVVHASTTPGGKVFSQVAAMAALDVRALDARAGAVVASTQKQERGFGRTPQAAQDDAASKAGLGAGNDLAAVLVAKEDSGL
jgi:hypothetical protein